MGTGCRRLSGVEGLSFKWFTLPESHFFKRKVTVNSLAHTRSPPVFAVSSSGPKPVVGVVRPPLWWTQATPRGWAGPRVVPRGAPEPLGGPLSRTHRPPAAWATPSRTCSLDCPVHPVHGGHLRQKGLYMPAWVSPLMDQDPVTGLALWVFLSSASQLSGERAAAPAPRKDTRAENHTHRGFLGQ